MSKTLESILGEYKDKTSESKKVWERLRKSIVDGVGCAGRYYRPYPLVVDKAEGSRIWDVDGNEYIDFYFDWGPLVLGHSNPKIVKALKEQAEKGTMYGLPYEKLADYVEELKKRYPADLFRLTNSGTEATLHAIRTARGYTGKDKIVKMEGGFHGIHNDVLVSFYPPVSKVGPSWAPSPYLDSSGVPSDTRKNTLVAPFNDIAALESLFRKHEGEIAAVIVEPVMLFHGVIPPKEGYLKNVRKLTEEYNVVLIFDEVKTGSKIAYGGACKYFDVVPDMLTLGKAIGCGLPIAAFGGKEEIMNEVSQQGSGVHIGTYNGNPLSISGGLAGLRSLTRDVYKKMDKLSEMLGDGIQDCLDDEGLTGRVQRVSSIGAVYLGISEEIRNFREAARVNIDLGWRYWLSMVNEGIFFSPGTGAGGNWHLSSVHTKRDIEKVLEKNKMIIQELSD